MYSFIRMLAASILFWHTELLAGCLSDRFIDRLIDWSIDRSLRNVFDWLVDWPIDVFKYATWTPVVGAKEERFRCSWSDHTKATEWHNSRWTFSMSERVLLILSTKIFKTNKQRQNNTHCFAAFSYHRKISQKRHKVRSFMTVINAARPTLTEAPQPWKQSSKSFTRALLPFRRIFRCSKHDVGSTHHNRSGAQCKSCVTWCEFEIWWFASNHAPA